MYYIEYFVLIQVKEEVMSLGRFLGKELSDDVSIWLTKDKEKHLV